MLLQIILFICFTSILRVYGAEKCRYASNTTEYHLFFGRLNLTAAIKSCESQGMSLLKLEEDMDLTDVVDTVHKCVHADNIPIMFGVQDNSCSEFQLKWADKLFSCYGCNLRNTVDDDCRIRDTYRMFNAI